MRKFSEATMVSNRRPPELSADQWIMFGKIAAALSAILFGISVAVLSLANPTSRCPAWQLPNGDSLWFMIWGWTLPLAVISCVIATFWKRMAHAALQHDERPRSIFFGLITVRNQLPGPITNLIALMCVVPAVMSNLPLSFIMFQCGWPFL